MDTTGPHAFHATVTQTPGDPLTPVPASGVPATAQARPQSASHALARPQPANMFASVFHSTSRGTVLGYPRRSTDSWSRLMLSSRFPTSREGHQLIIY